MIATALICVAFGAGYVLGNGRRIENEFEPWCAAMRRGAMAPAFARPALEPPTLDLIATAREAA
jgi:hypothetical protein